MDGNACIIIPFDKFTAMKLAFRDANNTNLSSKFLGFREWLIDCGVYEHSIFPISLKDEIVYELVFKKDEDAVLFHLMYL